VAHSFGGFERTTIQAPMRAGLCLAALLAGCSGAPPAPVTGVHPA
jgi:hypothetical protein